MQVAEKANQVDYEKYKLAAERAETATAVARFVLWLVLVVGSVDIYGDQMVRMLEYSGVPLDRIDSCGFMAGPTGTCYWRGAATWKGMLILTLARGGDLTVLYGDLSLFSEEDATWMARLQVLFEEAFASGGADGFGGVPGLGEPYGWSIGGKLLVAVNPQPVIGMCPIPPGDWNVLFSDAGFVPSLYDDAVALGPFQMVLLGLTDESFGVQEDCVSVHRRLVKFEEISRTPTELTIEVPPGEYLVIAQQRDEIGRLVRKFGDGKPFASTLSISSSRGSCQLEHDRIVWSGMSWGAATIVADGGGPVRIDISTTDSGVESLDVQIWE